ncbi:MAG: hypothetical protein LBB74_01565 [Chitinispirillales bacterium]|jgi:hypothetical protein|nr:hypothetical protein [Chitinispirillales bacterium]
MTKIDFLRKTATAFVTARGVFFSAVLIVFGWLLVSCAGTEAIRSAPSIDAVAGLKNKLIWLKANAQTGGEYLIELSNNELISYGFSKVGSLSYKDRGNITITVRGVGENRIVQLANGGDALFYVGAGVTLILDSNITLRGPQYVDGPVASYRELVSVASDGTFVMNEGSAITGNTNNFSYHGGGVNVSGGGIFIMKGGTISGNKCLPGLAITTSHVMGQEIGHSLVSSGMSKINEKVGSNLKAGETAPKSPDFKGGGVYVGGGGEALFSKKINPSGVFIKTGGTITGYDSDQENGNVVMAGEVVGAKIGDGQENPQRQLKYSVSADGGHAVYFGGKEPKIINTTVGPGECFEFRDGAYRDIQCEQPKPAEVITEPADVGVAALAPEVSEAEEVDSELVAAFAEAGPAQVAEAVLPVPAAATALPDVVSALAVTSVPEEEAAVQEVPAAVSAQQQLYGEPNVAAYVFGAKDPGLNKAMSTRLVIALAKSGRYQASENYMEFFDRAVEEQKNGMDVNLIKGLGERFGADYVCVAEIVTVFGEERTFAHLLRVKTAKSTAKGASELPLKTLADLTAASEQIVESMFKKVQPPAAAAPSAAPARSYETPAPCMPSKEEPVKAGEGAVEAGTPRKSKTGFVLGYGLSGKAGIMQLGGVHIRPITEKVISLAVETNFRFGEWNSRFAEYSETISYYGINIPVLCTFEKSVFFSEAGAFLDVLSAKNDRTSESAWMTNIGVALGGGLAFGKGYTQYFYRFNYGTAYYSHAFGIRQLF